MIYFGHLNQQTQRCLLRKWFFKVVDENTVDVDADKPKVVDLEEVKNAGETNFIDYLTIMPISI